jgi:amino acid transporter
MSQITEAPVTPGATTGLQRKTNWWGAFVIGLAGTILVTGIAPPAVQAMGAAATPVFLACSLAAVVLCLCLAELAAMMPDRTGGMPSYATHTFADFGPTVSKHVGGLSAWGYWLAWFPVAPINMIIAASYLVTLFDLPRGADLTLISSPISTTVLAISIAGMVLFFIPCLYGIQLGARFATVLGILSMVPITALVFLPFLRPEAIHWDQVAGFALPDPARGTFTFYVCWIFIMAWSVLAIEAAACYIGECREPARDAKIALTLASAYGAFIYVAVPLMLVAVLGSTMSAEGYGDMLVAFLAYTRAIFGDRAWVQWVIGIPIVTALLFTVLHAIMGCGRSLYQASEDGTLPRFFQHTNRHGVPDFAMTFNLLCSIVVVFFGSPLEIYIFSVVGYLLCVGLALIGYFLYRHNHPELPRPFRLPGFVRFLALALGVIVLFIWAYGGYYAADIVVPGDPPRRWLFFLGLGILSLYVPLYLYRRGRGRPFRLRQGSGETSP